MEGHVKGALLGPQRHEPSKFSQNLMSCRAALHSSPALRLATAGASSRGGRNKTRYSNTIVIGRFTSLVGRNAILTGRITVITFHYAEVGDISKENTRQKVYNLKVAKNVLTKLHNKGICVHWLPRKYKGQVIFVIQEKCFNF